MTPDDGPLLSLLMLVTPRDWRLARQTIRSYRKLYNAHHPYARRFRLVVYLNCLPPDAARDLRAAVGTLPFCELRDSQAAITARVPGEGTEMTTTPEGISIAREGDYELCGEVWTRELPQLDTRYVGTVDSDFEVLAPDFLLRMLEELEGDDSLAGVSTEHSSTAEVFDTYSNRTIVLHERWHTWCCIYRRQPLLAATSSHAYFEERLPDGRMYVYDDAARLQMELIERLGFRFAVLPAVYRWSCIHYSASSKLKGELTASGARFYRYAHRLSSQRVLCGSHWQEHRTARRVNYVVGRVASRLTRSYRQRLTVEKSVI
jgi:hypothetical protein